MSFPNIFGAGFPMQDFILLGGKKSPGKADVFGASTPRKWDERTGYGLSGAFIVYTGDGLAHFPVVISLWEESHFDEWDSFATVLEKAPIGTRAKALGISHPLLTVRPLKIASVVVEDVTQFVQDDYGLWTCEIRLGEFRRPLPALGKPSAAIPAAALAVPTARDAAEAQIQALQGQVNTLAAGL